MLQEIYYIKQCLIKRGVTFIICAVSFYRQQTDRGSRLHQPEHEELTWLASGIVRLWAQTPRLVCPNLYVQVYCRRITAGTDIVAEKSTGALAVLLSPCLRAYLFSERTLDSSCLPTKAMRRLRSLSQANKLKSCAA